MPGMTPQQRRNAEAKIRREKQHREDVELMHKMKKSFDKQDLPGNKFLREGKEWQQKSPSTNNYAKGGILRPNRMT